VKGTPLDFTTATPIGKRMKIWSDRCRRGHDHNFVLNKPAGRLGLAAEAYDPANGRVLTIYTTEPGVQFYSGNYLSGAIGKQGLTYPRRSGFCLETQHFPDSPNEPRFPTTVLRPAGRYAQTTIYQFSVRR
jgi:aldose 1-epimerase